MASSILLLLFLLAPPGDLDAAGKALAAGQHEEALSLLGELASGREASIDALIVQGRALLGLRRYEGAVEPLLRASDARREDRTLARDAAYACWGSAQGAFAGAYLDDARRYALRSGDALLVADLSHARGDPESALAEYGALELGDENRLHILSRMVECLRSLGREQEAKAAAAPLLDEAMRRADLLAAYRAAFVAGQGGRLVQWLDGRLATNPDDHWSLLYRAYALDMLQQDERAIADLRRIGEVMENQQDARARLALVLIRWGIRRQAEEPLREAETIALEMLEADPRHAAAWQAISTIAWYAATNGRVQRAYEVLKRMTAIDPEDEATALNFCAMARRLGHDGEARATFERLLESDPYSADVLVDFGILEDGAGRRSEAVALWRRALDVRPRDLNALENLYTCAWERGDRAEAMEMADRAMTVLRGARGDESVRQRWLWLRDRLLWTPRAFEGSQ